MIKQAHTLIAGIGLGLIISACATPFPYPYFGIDLKDQKLLGATVAQDEPLSICDATATDASPCIALQASVFLELKKAYKDTQDALIKCQQGSQ